MNTPSFDGIDKKYKQFFKVEQEIKGYAVAVTDDEQSNAIVFGMRGKLHPFSLNDPFVGFATNNLVDNIYHESTIGQNSCNLKFGRNFGSFGVETDIYSVEKGDTDFYLTVYRPNWKLSGMFGQSALGISGVYQSLNSNIPVCGYTCIAKDYSLHHRFKIRSYTCNNIDFSSRFVNMISKVDGNLVVDIDTIKNTSQISSGFMYPVSDTIKVGVDSTISSSEHGTTCGLEIAHDKNNTFKCNVGVESEAGKIKPVESIGVSWSGRIADNIRLVVSNVFKSNAGHKTGLSLDFGNGIKQ